LTLDINIYDVYGTCWHSDSEQYGEKHQPKMYELDGLEIVAPETQDTYYKKYVTHADYTPFLKSGNMRKMKH